MEFLNATQADQSNGAPGCDWPIVVDLDGTLTPSDTLLESMLLAVKQQPSVLFMLPLWLRQGRAVFKASIAERVSNLTVGDTWPYRNDLLEYLRYEKSCGRRIVLATAAHRSIAEPVAVHLDLFESVLASDANCNLKGNTKLAAIRKHVGPDFIYAGDSDADLPIWQASRGAILVDVSPRVARELGKDRVPIVREFKRRPPGLSDWRAALRLHQWLKNTLIYVPLITAFAFTDLGLVAVVIAASLSFSLAASATYIGNDLWDLHTDRRHPRKRLRPFASGRISIPAGLAVATLLLLAALALASVLPRAFLALLILYVGLTSTYSWMLKAYVLIDVLLLALLYTLRIVAGGAASGIAVSLWLLGFSVFMFLSLALIKRCAELVSMGQAGIESVKGRDYRVADLVVLWPMGVGSGLCAVVVFALFASAPDVATRYGTPGLLWLVAVGLIYWLARLWIKTARGEMDDDPVVYAIRDFGSRVTIIAMLASVLAARFVRLG
jgi:4-hydroxybenzoate polyprenyltransferase/phosphoserine phosphatase